MEQAQAGYRRTRRRVKPFAGRASKRVRTHRSKTESVAAAGTPANAQTGAKRERQAGIADGRDVLVVEKIFGLRVDVEPIQQLIAASDVELGVAVIEIAIGQEQAVVVRSVLAFKIC